jgi:haloalkane dehalogenase
MSGYGVRTADAHARSARAAAGPDGVGSTSMQTLRTPDDRFADLPGYSFAPHYADVADGEGGTLRVHYVREGDPSAPVVLLMHGEPSWSYLYRTMIPVLTGAGLQIVAPDLVGFGRSDKPAERTDYTFARHVEWMRELLFDRLDLTDINLVCQDWGGLIGLRLVGEHPGRFARVVAANTFLPTGDTNPGDAFFAWQKFSQEVEVFPTGVIVRGGCAKPVAPEVEAAYDAPFPDESYKSGARQFPLLVPSQPDDPAHDANVAAWVGLAAFDRPFLCAFSDSDPITKGADRNLKERIAGAQGQPHTTIVGGGHFLQEDCGEDLAAVVVSFVTATP